MLPDHVFPIKSTPSPADSPIVTAQSAQAAHFARREKAVSCEAGKKSAFSWIFVLNDFGDPFNSVP
jgi:hypothetical protein